MKWVTALLALSLVFLLSSTIHGAKLEGKFPFFLRNNFLTQVFRARKIERGFKNLKYCVILTIDVEQISFVYPIAYLRSLTDTPTLN